MKLFRLRRRRVLQHVIDDALTLLQFDNYVQSFAFAPQSRAPFRIPCERSDSFIALLICALRRDYPVTTRSQIVERKVAIVLRARLAVAQNVIGLLALGRDKVHANSRRNFIACFSSDNTPAQSCRAFR